MSQTVNVEWKMGTGSKPRKMSNLRKDAAVGNTNHHRHTHRPRSQSPFSGSQYIPLTVAEEP